MTTDRWTDPDFDAMAGAEAADLVDEAWRRAREDVVEELRGRMREALRRAALGRVEGGSPGSTAAPVESRTPAEAAPDPVTGSEAAAATAGPVPDPAPPATGWYVFGVTDAEPGAVAGWSGMDPDGPTTGVGRDGLVAVACPVALDQFEEEQFRAHVDDVGWLEAKVRAHEAVLERLLDVGSALPMRFGSIYRSIGDVEAMLERHRGALSEGLAKVRGRVEWSVRGRVDRPALERWVRGRLPRRAVSEPRGEGSAYLAERARERVVADAMDAELAGAAARVESQIGEAATGWTRADAPARRDAGFAFGVAFLVERVRTHEFLRAVEAVRAELEPRGITLEATGPWPPSSFTSMDLTVEAGS